uniref:MARVEL domain-containing protein n=1 Tax=Angiostrongylus cantonensis TaxID=6313 RepID=A0A0K0DRD2_ANGCA
MNLEFLQTLHGFINLLQVCFGFAAIFASSLIWVDSSVYFQFIYKGFGWQTLILFILVATFIFSFTILLSNIFGKDVLGSIGKKKLLLLYAICTVLLIASGSLETWYIGLSAGYLHNRFITVTVRR